jgi:iron complex outermembrane receptor protein
LGGGIQFKNIVGASRSRQQNLAAEIGAPYLLLTTYNVDLGPASLEGNANDEVVDSISEEPQLQGKYFNDSLSHIVGLYFQRTRSFTIYPATYTDVAPIIPPAVSTSAWKQRDTTRAIYTNGSWNLGSIGINNLTFSAGARYSWEAITSDQLAGSRFYPGPNQEVSFHKPSWNVGFEYQVTANLMTYIESRGSWRSGGINGIAAPMSGYGVTGGSSFEPETTEDIEVGTKWSGEAAGHPAHLYLAAYNQWIKNVQRSQYVQLATPLQLTINVPSARVRGIELDTGMRLTDFLQLGLVSAYTDATYVDNAFVAFGQSFLFGPYADSPRWTGSLYGEVTMPVPDSVGKVALRADVYGQTGQYTSNTNSTLTPDTYLPGYGLTNLRLDWRNVMGRQDVTVSMFVKNLFDRGYYVGGFALGNLEGVNSASVGEPRMWGAEVKYGF